MLLEFLNPFNVEQVSSSQNQKSYLDSNLQISNGVFIVAILTKEESFWENGLLKFYRYYNEGNPFGNWEYYNQNGLLMYSISFTEKHYLLKSHFVNHNISSIRKYAINSLSLETKCVEEDFYPDGSMEAFGKKEPITIINKIELVETGKWHYFHTNGKLESVGKYKKGLKEGHWTYYNTSGKKTRMVTFKKGNVMVQKEY
jgi:antitoxin component YwqK of YwqJK toxin-antitoxin module